ncbi:response regulator [Halobacteriovorax sp. GB3]|uniref:response regulator n=1 Tax=Halobacteriovorax sp. GB3 TaxID=2719615 RepID=UPI0023600224|nr:response regulator [Halobacteriovorax sp. GB3]
MNMFQKMKILTIDDDIDINKYLELIFKKNNYDIRCTTNTKDFLEQVLAFKPHLIIVDLNLEEQGFGYKIIQTLRKKFGPEMIIIVMSRRNTHDDITKALELGANDYITKPIDDALLFNKVRLFLKQSLDEDSTFAYYAVPTKNNALEFTIPLTLKKLTESGIQFFSKSLIAKEAPIQIEGALAKQLSPSGKIRFQVKDVVIDKMNDGFLVTVEFSLDEHYEIKRNVRKLLLKVAPTGIETDEFEEEEDSL